MRLPGYIPHGLLGIGIAILLVAGFLMSGAAAEGESESNAGCEPGKDAFCVAGILNPLSERLSTLSLPKIATPVWLAPPETSGRTVTYTVEGRGTITSDLDEFATFASATLNDSRGWARLGVSFEQVAKNGNFVLVLSQASQVPSFSSAGCDTTYSCNVGNYVIINEDRWKNATPSYNNAGVALVTYRHMVINHETGHWLGHGHSNCNQEGQPATVMQQQSISLQGCTANPWPLTSEMYSPKLGIRS